MALYYAFKEIARWRRKQEAEKWGYLRMSNFVDGGIGSKIDGFVHDWRGSRFRQSGANCFCRLIGWFCPLKIVPAQ
jgi:hypothetical protein